MNEAKEIYLLTTDGYRESLFLDKYASSYEELEKIARFYLKEIYDISVDEINSVLLDRIGKRILIKYDDDSDQTFHFIVIKPFNDRT